MMAPEQLAIVIPAYKAAYLRRTLESILSQTDQRFGLYVGDDGSSEPIGDSVRAFQGRRPLMYHRFEENLGRTSLVRHWHRCITMSAEPWVWLFSDDDEMDSRCVAAFYETLQETGGAYNTYRFNVTTIDKEGRARSLYPPHPAWEGWMQYAYFRLRGLRHSTAQEVIFSRSAYDRAGGFPDFPLAWAADIAGLIAFAEDRGIRLIDGARIRFRHAGQNISSAQDRRQTQMKLHAAKLFMQWFSDYAEGHSDKSFLLAADELREQAQAWFMRTLTHTEAFYGPRACAQLGSFISELWGGSSWINSLRVAKRNLTGLGRRMDRSLRTVFGPDHV